MTSLFFHRIGIRALSIMNSVSLPMATVNLGVKVLRLYLERLVPTRRGGWAQVPSENGTSLFPIVIKLIDLSPRALDIVVCFSNVRNTILCSQKFNRTMQSFLALWKSAGNHHALLLRCGEWLSRLFVPLRMQCSEMIHVSEVIEFRKWALLKLHSLIHNCWTQHIS